MNQAGTTDPLSTLCLRCGLCCDGTLFTQVPLAADEAAALQRRALPVLQRADGTPALQQRCAALEGRCCAVYEARPASCRGFRCMLHAALAEGEVGLDEALATVDEAHALLAAAPLPAGGGAIVQRAQRAAQDEALPPEVRAGVRRLLHLLGRSFRGGFAR